MKPILIVGATGTVGRQVIRELSAKGVPVRALSRNPDSAALPPQVEIVRGDLTVPATLEPALADTAAVFLVWTAPAAAVPPALEKILSRATRIVFLSAPHQTPHPFFQQPNPVARLHAEIERQIQASGVPWTFLRPGMFASNVRGWWTAQIRAGDIVRWPYAEAETAPIHERDVATVGVRALCDAAHQGKQYVLTGPQPLTHREQVNIIADRLGRPLRFEEISPDEARRELLTIMPAPAIEMLLNAWAATIGHPALVSSEFAQVTGTPPRTFRDWVIEYAAEFHRVTT